MENTLFITWLQALELLKATVTATIDSRGHLGKVGGLWPKLLAAAEATASLGLLQVVIVAQEQEDVAAELTDPTASPLRVIKAATLQEAVEKLYAEHGPRAAVCQHELKECSELQRLDEWHEPLPIDPNARHYQVLPLLQEVKRERLPRDPRALDDEDDTMPALRLADIARWEEELSEERVTYAPEPVSVEQLFDQFQQIVKQAGSAVPRFVVLGSPGSGKSTLLQYLGWLAAQGRLRIDGRQLLPVRIQLRAWEAWAVKPLDPEASLAEYLAECYKHLSPAPTITQWNFWLQRGEILLMLDGLDEIVGHEFFTIALKRACSTFKHCPIVLTCRTVSFQEHRTVCPDFPVFTLAGLEDEQRDAYIHAFRARHRERYIPEALVDQLNRLPQMRPLAANPLLLSIICFVVDDPHGVTLPITRGALYDKAVQKLLRRTRVTVMYPGSKQKLPLIRKRRMLERVALTLFAGVEPQRHLSVDQGQLLDALTAAAQAEGLAHAADVADSLLDDLTHNSGLLRGDPENGYFFLHLTVQEFLAGAALARLVDDGPGWTAQLTIGERVWMVQDLVDKKAWDPRWQEVITLLAGRVKNPLPLLELLSTSASDDLFRHRLCLAARCLEELPSEGGQGLSRPCRNVTRRIVQESFKLWWEYIVRGTRLRHITKCFSALAQGSPTIVLPMISEHLRDSADQTLKIEALAYMSEAVAWPLLARTLYDDSAFFHNKSGKVETMRALRHLDEDSVLHRIPLHPEILACVATALRSKDVDVCTEAILVLQNLGGVAARHLDVLPTLAFIAVTDMDEVLGYQAGWALSQMGQEVMHHPEVFPFLVKIAKDKERHMRTRARAVAALGQLGEVAARHPDVLSAMVIALRDGDAFVRLRVGAALGRLGEAAMSHPDILPKLLRRARDNRNGDWSWEVRARLVAILGRLWETAPHRANVLSTLRSALYDESDQVRSEAIAALRRLDEAVMRYPGVLPKLLRILNHKDGHGRYHGVELWKWLGEAITRDPNVLPLLALALHNKEILVRFQALVAPRQKKEASLQNPDILPALARIVQDTGNNEYIRVHAIETLGKLGEVAAQYSYVSYTLVEVILHNGGGEDLPSSSARNLYSAAVKVLAQMGKAATGHPEVLLALLKATLQTTNKAMRLAAITLLGQLGRAAVRCPDALPALVAALNDEDQAVRSRAAEALERITAEGIRVFKGHLGSVTWHGIVELSA